MAAWASQQDGDWSDSSENATSPWYDDGAQSALSSVPGNGDTVTITHAVTVDANTTVGTSPAAVADWTDGSDASIVLEISGTSSQLIIDEDVTLKHRGSIYAHVGELNNVRNGIVMAAGSGLVKDSSQQVGDDQASYMVLRDSTTDIVCNGTSAKHCTVEALDGYGIVAFPISTLISVNLGGGVTATYTDFARVGNTGRYGFWTGLYGPDDYSFTWSTTNCTFTECGGMYLKNSYKGSLTFEDCQVLNPVGSEGHLASFVGRAGETNNIKRNVFGDPNETIQVSITKSDGCTFENNVFRSAPTISASVGPDSFANNLICHGNMAVNNTAYGTYSNNYFFFDLANENYGFWILRCSTNDTVLEGCIFDTASALSDEQADKFTTDSPAGRTVIVRNNLNLPNSLGFNDGRMWSDHQCDTGAETEIRHNTAVSTRNSGLGEHEGSHIGFGEAIAGGGSNDTFVTAYKDNLIWTPSWETNQGWKVTRLGAEDFQDFILSANCVGNWGWNLDEGSEGDGYQCENEATSFFSSGSPDEAGNGDPRFKAVVQTAQRNLATFDTLYLGNTSETAWDEDPHSYSVGDVCNNTDANFFFGVSVNYRCIVDHTSGASTEPGVGADWRDKWQLQSVWRCEQDTSNIALLMAWVKDAYVVQNPDLEDAGSDGNTIGAQGYEAAGGGRLLLLGVG